MSLVEQELLTLSEYLRSPPIFSGVRVARSLVLCVMFCRTLFFLLLFCFCPLCSLSFFELRILSTPCILCPSLNYAFWVSHCVLCPSLNSAFWVSLWYFQTFLPDATILKIYFFFEIASRYLIIEFVLSIIRHRNRCEITSLSSNFREDII